jgi:hypothetical protein
MSISGIGSYPSVLPSQTISSSPQPNNNESCSSCSKSSSNSSNSDFFNDVFKSLNDLGLNTSSSSSFSISIVNINIGGSSNQDEDPISQAIYDLVNQLLQSLNPMQDQSNNNQGDSNERSGSIEAYTSFSTSLSGFIGSLDSEGATQTKNTLQEGFDKLIDAIGNSGTASSPSLSDFLNQLQNNVNTNSTQLGGSGTFFSAEA